MGLNNNRDALLRAPLREILKGHICSVPVEVLMLILGFRELQPCRGRTGLLLKPSRVMSHTVNPAAGSVQAQAALQCVGC